MLLCSYLPLHVNVIQCSTKTIIIRNKPTVSPTKVSSGNPTQSPVKTTIAPTKATPPPTTNAPTKESTPTQSPTEFTEKVLYVTIQPLAIDFESDVDLNLFNKNEGWAISEGEGVNGTAAAKTSSDLDDGESASLELLVDYAHGGHFSLSIKSSLTQESDELFQIFINDTLKYQTAITTSEFFLWRQTFPMGKTNVTWKYSNGVGGQGNVWIDNIDMLPYVIDDFETGDFSYLPWSVQAGWVVDSSKPFSGEYSAHFNDTVLPADVRTLSFPISTESGGVCSFRIWTDIGMPFDQLLILLDGTAIQGYIEPTGLYVPFGIGIEPGEHEVGFQYRRPGFTPPIDRNETQYGTGQVWLDSIRFIPS